MTVARAIAICGVGVVLLSADVAAQSDPQGLREVERERLRSLVDANMGVASRLHADDFQLITPTGVTVSKDEYLRLVASGDVDYLEWEPGDIDIRMCDGVAVLRYRARLRIVVRGQPDAPSGRFWHTDVYERRGDRWQVVWSQATEIRQ